ncbi:hypothetical protein EDC04DRAFT_2930902 [Pisolithus marmoratus]|nr:hypothetical protein EDC04DRAFT_2930902 [Pisolithus marmoratus]
MYRIIMEEVPVEQTKMRLHALRDMREIFLKAFAKPVNDAQAHLRRIMADAGAGILKYDLLCSARTKLNLEGPSAATSAHEFQPASVTGGSKRQSTGMTVETSILLGEKAPANPVDHNLSSSASYHLSMLLFTDSPCLPCASSLLFTCTISPRLPSIITYNVSLTVVLLRSYTVVKAINYNIPVLADEE